MLDVHVLTIVKGTPNPNANQRLVKALAPLEALATVVPSPLSYI